MRLVLRWITAAALIAAALWGTWFSPGFTAIFLAVFCVSYTAISLLPQRLMRTHAALGAVSALFVLPATYIYAAGDDRLQTCVWVTLLAAAAAYILLVALVRRSVPVLEHVCRVVLLAAGLFTVACGVSSVALLPVGIGVLLCFAARYLRGARRLLTYLGIALCCVFLIVPMLFGGGA